MSRNRILLISYFALAGGLMMLALVKCDSGITQEQDDQSAPPVQQASSGKQKWKNLHDSVQYVGKQTCKQCHAGVSKSFHKTGMGQSFGPATQKVSDARFKGHPSVYDSVNDFHYTPYWRDSNLYIKEYRLNEQGDTIHKRKEQIDYIIGSGHHTNSHMYQVNGYLYQAPLTFYTQEGKWDLPPGFDDGANSRYSRMIKTECMTCHNMYPDNDELSANRYNSIPSGIGCERCHGPGELHVQQKMKGEIVDTSERADRTIVNPAKLKTSLKNDVCQRCHLQGNTVTKPGKDFFDFKPGMKLSSVMSVFRPQFESDDAFIMASHSERLQKSTCFKQTRKQQNAEALNCITCHNPHKSVQSTEADYFNSTCKDCHGGRNQQEAQIQCSAPKQKRMSNDNNCVECHMPKSGSVDIPHVSIHDHNIRVVDSQNKKREDVPADIDALTVNSLKSYNNKNPNTRTLTKAYLFYYEKFRSKPKFLDSAYHYLTQLPRAQYQEEWVHYYYLNQEFGQVTEFLQERDSIRLSKPRSAYHAGQAYANLGKHQKAQAYYKQAVDEKPYNLNYQNKLASMYIENQKLRQAERTLTFILSENPKQPVAQNNRGFLYLAEQNFRKARQHFEKAISLNPDYGRPYLNMAKVYLGKQAFGKAEQQLQTVRSRFPELQKEARRILKLVREQQPAQAREIGFSP